MRSKKLGFALDRIDGLLRYDEPEVEYARKVKEVLNAHPDMFSVDDIDQFMDDSFDILGSAEHLLSPEEFTPLLGKLQMVMLADVLERAGIAFWNLGQPYMEYKIKLGAEVVPRGVFLKRWDKAVRGKTINL